MSSPPTTPSPPRSATTSRTPSPRRDLASDDDKLALTSAVKPEHPSRTPSPPPAAAAKTPVFPSREDCWSEEATRTLIEAWGAQYLNLNRGNLRQKHWQEVANAVNAVHAAKLRRSDVQCKNRIDTTKKKYKIEKSKVVDSNGRYVSAWPHFESLDALIGDFFSKTPTAAAVNGHTKNLRRRVSSPTEISPSPPPSPATFTGYRSRSPPIHRRGQDPPADRLPRLPWSVPVGPRSKRSGITSSVTERNFSVMAAAAAAMEAEEDDDDDYDDEGFRSRVRRLPPPATGKNKKRRVEERTGLREGYRMVAEAIMRFGEIYEKVEMAKQRQMMECEKQRMQFAEDLERFRAQIHFQK